jgi:hypothetical protein
MSTQCVAQTNEKLLSLDIDRQKQSRTDPAEISRDGKE